MGREEGDIAEVLREGREGKGGKPADVRELVGNVSFKAGEGEGEG